VQRNDESSPFVRIIIDLPPDVAKEFKQLMHQTGDNPTNLFRKALGLYKLSKEAIQQRLGSSLALPLQEQTLSLTGSERQA
jgi:hypothetical protein